jgi:hypothetical protein
MTCLTLAATVIGLASANESYAQTATDLVCRGCVDSRDIATAAVTRKKIAKGSVSPNRLQAPTGAAATTPSDQADFGQNETLQSITVDLPTKGMVVVNVSAYFRFDTADGEVACTITKGNVVQEPRYPFNGSNVEADRRVTLGATRGFVEDSGGEKTYKLVCTHGASDNVDMYDAVMTAIYAPTNILVP